MKKFEIAALVVSVPIAILAIYIIIKLLIKYVKYLGKIRWVDTTATITDISVDPNTTQLIYTYEYKNMSYNGNIEVNNSTYKKDSTINIKVNPKNPEETYFDADSKLMKAEYVVLFIFCLASLIAIFAYYYRKYKQYRAE